MVSFSISPLLFFTASCIMTLFYIAHPQHRIWEPSGEKAGAKYTVLLSVLGGICYD